MKCETCDKEFSSTEGLQHHKQAKHGAKAKKTLPKKYLHWTIAVMVTVIVLGGGYTLINKATNQDVLAQCVTDSGATFYGAFWCSNCGAQKQLFGSSTKLLPYVECSTPSREVTPLCKKEDITNYPTWKFADGTVRTGVIPLDQLAKLTGCS